MDDLRHLLAIYVHAHRTGNSVPPHIDAEARAALAAAPPVPAPTINDIYELCEDHEFHLGGNGADEEESAESLLQIIRIALSRWGNQPPALDPREALAARPLLEAVVSLDLATWGEEVYNGRLPALQQRIGAWLAQNPPGQPVAIEPRGCPAPGACSCVEPPAPDPEPSDFQAFQGLALDMIESLRPIVIPEILGVLRKAIKSTGQPAPATDGEREELAQWLYRLADERSCNRRRGIRPHPSALTRAAVLLQQPAPAPVPVSERPWERPGWCDTEGRCWIGTPETEYPLGDTGDYDLIDASWSLELPPSDPALHRMQRVVSHPHWAIPQPPHGGEVAG
jgi:hypothetical protein